MKKLRNLIGCFRRSNDGASAIEYGLITATIAVVLIVSLTTIGTETNETFSAVGNTLSSAQSN